MQELGIDDDHDDLEAWMKKQRRRGKGKGKGKGRRKGSRRATVNILRHGSLARLEATMRHTLAVQNQSTRSPGRVARQVTTRGPPLPAAPRPLQRAGSTPAGVMLRRVRAAASASSSSRPTVAAAPGPQMRRASITAAELPVRRSETRISSLPSFASRASLRRGPPSHHDSVGSLGALELLHPIEEDALFDGDAEEEEEERRSKEERRGEKRRSIRRGTSFTLRKSQSWKTRRKLTVTSDDELKRLERLELAAKVASAFKRPLTAEKQEEGKPTLIEAAHAAARWRRLAVRARLDREKGDPKALLLDDNKAVGNDQQPQVSAAAVVAKKKPKKGKGKRQRKATQADIVLGRVGKTDSTQNMGRPQWGQRVPPQQRGGK